MLWRRGRRFDSRLGRRWDIESVYVRFEERSWIRLPSPLQEFISQAAMPESVLPCFEICLVRFLACFEPGDLLRSRDSVSCEAMLTAVLIAAFLHQAFP